MKFGLKQKFYHKNKNKSFFLLKTHLKSFTEFFKCYYTILDSFLPIA